MTATASAPAATANQSRTPPVNTGLPLPLERFYYWEKSQPSKVCFTQPMGGGQTREFTWGEVGRQVRSVARYLTQTGVKPGDRVAIISKNCAHWIMSDLAIWMAGGVSVPLYPTLTSDAVRQILDHSESGVVFIGKLDDWPQMQAGVSESLHRIGYPLSPAHEFATWDDIVAKVEPMTESPSRSHGELATIIYTSGTTGMPKGVMHTFNSMASGVSQVSNIYEVNRHDRALSYLPLSHVAERMCVEMVQLYEGIHVYFAESLDTFARDLALARPTLFFSVPRLWAKFQAGVFSKFPERRLSLLLKVPVLNSVLKRKILQALGLDQVRYCLSGAAPISSSLLQWYRTLGIEILEVYGMTENMGYSHANRAGQSRQGYVGKPNPLVEVKIGEGGEVLVRSPTTMIGYYKEPQKTAEALDDDGFLRTGDVGVIEPDGSLRITGRIKEIFKTAKGKYVAPFPIESKLLADAHVEQCCVVGNAMPQPIALVALSEGDREALRNGVPRDTIHADLLDLFNRVNAQLDPHEKLKTMVVTKGDWTIENGIMTPTLKIKRNVLESRYEDRIEKWYESQDKVQWEWKLLMRWRWPSVRWLCALWLLVLLAAPAHASLLWQLEKDGKVHYLFGTIHISDPEVIQLPAPVETVVNSASALVVEVVLDDATRQAIAERTLLSSSTLKKVLGMELFNEVASAVKARGVPPSSLLRLKPWAVGLMLNVPTPSLEPVLDVHLQYRFADSQRPVHGLETIDEQLDIFDQLALAEQIEFLKTSLAQHAEFDASFRRMKALYLAGDLEQIEHFARAQSAKSASSTMDKLMYRILEERNHRMFARVQSHLAQSGVLIAVGALHLPGQQGLLQMFRDAGYSVRAVTP